MLLFLNLFLICFICNIKIGIKNRPWWPRGLECVSNSSRHSPKDPGSNPTQGNKYGQIYIVTNTPTVIVVPLFICLKVVQLPNGLLFKPLPVYKTKTTSGAGGKGAILTIFFW